MPLTLSAAFPPGLDTPAHVAEAEALGYERAWLYDSPALYHDVWMTLARCAAATTDIGLGPAVLVPSLRHPMVTAAAVATLADLAPGRVAVAVGAGFTGRHVLGQRAMRWADVRRYLEVLRALLRGEEVEWEGRPIAMVHGAGYGADRPIDAPILVAADGPRGTAAAAELGDGYFSAAVPNPAAAGHRHALLQFGTVLDPGEPPTGERVVEAAGPAVAVALHGLYERGGAAAVDALPGGTVWREAVEALPPDRRHLATHEGHLVALSDRDRAALAAGAAALIPGLTLTGEAADVRARVEALAAAGVTEVAFQPCGGDIGRELASFAAAVRG
ncbi:MAG TPA: LLM class flavin-dependent oxidoreductase [Acidimicrobiales bacterium]|nr:LLM class flavin-dependent oxidoreductase [Acidimicrobiales bacterium]